MSRIILTFFVAFILQISSTVVLAGEDGQLDSLATHPVVVTSLLFVCVLLIIALSGLGYVSYRIKTAARSTTDEQLRLKRIVTGTGNGIWEWNINSGKMVYSAKFFDIVGLAFDQHSNKTPMDILKEVVHPVDRSYFLEKFNQHLDQGYNHDIDIEFRIVKDRKQVTWVWLRGAVIIDPQNESIVLSGMITDIFARKQQEKSIADLDKQTVIDSLTDMPNRGYLLANNNQIIQLGVKNNQAAVLQIDVDDFSKVNDRFGHGTGDMVLKIIGTRLKQCLRGNDTIIRLGGDEFCVMLPQTNKEQAIKASQKLLSFIAEPLNANDINHSINISIGIALYPEHGADYDSLISKADSAMQIAKRDRLGFSMFDPKLVQTGALELPS